MKWTTARSRKTMRVASVARAIAERPVEMSSPSKDELRAMSETALAIFAGPITRLPAKRRGRATGRRA